MKAEFYTKLLSATDYFSIFHVILQTRCVLLSKNQHHYGKERMVVKDGAKP